MDGRNHARLGGQKGSGRCLDRDTLEERVVVIDHFFKRRGSVVMKVRRGATDCAQVWNVDVLDIAGTLVVAFLGTSIDPATKYGEVVVPAKAGTQRLCDVRHWIPAFAGMTNF